MAEDLKANPSFEIKMEGSKDGGSDHNHTIPCTFTLDELVMATNNFAVDHVIGEVEAGRVYKGRLQSRDRVRFTYPCRVSWIIYELVFTLFVFATLSTVFMFYAILYRLWL